jgi:HEPN domain-containing protein
MADQRDLAEQLLGVARDDDAAARTLLEAESPDSVVGFHCQQAVEKALKAVLAARSVEFPFTHDIGLLIQLCEDAGVPLPDALADVDRLTPFAVHMRYGAIFGPDLDLAVALEWVANTIGWAEQSI